MVERHIERLATVEQPKILVPGLLAMINGEDPHISDAGGFQIFTDRGMIVVDAGSGKNHRRVRQNLDATGADSRKTIHLVTHQHFDHMNGVMKLIEHGYGSELWAPLPQPTVEPTGDVTASDLYDERFAGARVDRFLHDGEELVFGELRIHVLLTPGHAPDHACYLLLWRGMILAIFGDIDGGHSERLGGDLEARTRSIAKLSDQRFDAYVEGHGSLSHPLRPASEFRPRMRRFGESLKPGFGYLLDPMCRELR